MKHLYTLELNNDLIFIIINLLHLVAIDNNKQNVESKYKLGSFQLYDTSKFYLTIFIETKHLNFSNFQNEGSSQKWLKLRFALHFLNNC
jgi:hypothetical protein